MAGGLLRGLHGRISRASRAGTSKWAGAAGMVGTSLFGPLAGLGCPGQSLDEPVRAERALDALLARIPAAGATAASRPPQLAGRRVGGHRLRRCQAASPLALAQRRRRHATDASARSVHHPESNVPIRFRVSPGCQGRVGLSRGAGGPHPCGPRGPRRPAMPALPHRDRAAEPARSRTHGASIFNTAVFTRLASDFSWLQHSCFHRFSHAHDEF